MTVSDPFHAGQAKTIEEIHAEARTELGMPSATIIPALESLSALPRQAADEVELFPSFKGGKGNCTYALVSAVLYNSALVHTSSQQMKGLRLFTASALQHDSTQPTIVVPIPLPCSKAAAWHHSLCMLHR